MPSQGKLITFEGGEGAGKTTLIRYLQETLAQRGYDVISTREPGGSSLGEKVREILLHSKAISSIGSMAELLLFLADRSQHIEEVIRPALQRNAIVLCDRYSDSSIAYQGVGRGLGLETVQEMCRIVESGVSPNLTFFLDLDPKIGLKRVLKDRIQDKLEAEKITFHEKVREGFLTLAKQNQGRIVLVDASHSIENVCETVLKALEKIL